ncbi:hypothetical protein GGR57DRAFT_506826 [Xylariaceae sp. FL1272]|nr:hypothetical protein GGR57DRAFT_506826 [Xylariaceae sp. FL1272]
MNIAAWLQGIEPAAPIERAGLRRKLDHCLPDTFAHPFNTFPNTPPTTSMASGFGALKRGVADRSESGGDDGDIPDAATPRASTASSPKRRSASPTKKSAANLMLFEKPVYVQPIDYGATVLPLDVRSLYDQIGLAIDKEAIIPSEVREEVVSAVGPRAARDSRYRKHATLGAGALHASLQGILLEATAAERDEYHETGWNHHVHTPLLKLVCASREPDDEFARPPQRYPTSAQTSSSRPGSARFVSVMSATIHSEYAPRKRALPPPKLWATAPPLPASSMLHASGAHIGPGSASGSKSAASEIVIDGATYNRSDSKKVDYVLVVDARNHAPLRKVFSSVWNECLFRNILPHINHSLYRPLQWSPIACSIETKLELSSHAEPVLQLGTWVASWHKRMHILRQYLFDTVDGLQKEKVEELPPSTTSASGHRQHKERQKRLPTSLMIKVINQEWRLYFAVDSGDCINVYGPLNIGSTSNLIDAYVLLTVLEAIKDWIETTFREGVESWFMCETLE